jgi:hypothetical protein
MNPALYAKALYASVVAWLGALSAVLVGDIGISDLTDGQWVVVVLSALVAGGGVFGIPNKQP